MKALATEFPEARFHAVAGCITVIRRPLPALAGQVAVVCAGTSDLPLWPRKRPSPLRPSAAPWIESAMSASQVFTGSWPSRDRLEASNAVIVAAGMEGALPSAVAGLISKPVIAVPTSIGYGASFGGVAALLGMLNSCGSGVTVVNIDNGFGAAYAAANISRLLSFRETE